MKSVNNRSVQSKHRDYGTLENHSTTSQQQQDQTAPTTDILDSSMTTTTTEEHDINLSPQDYTRLNTEDILLTLSSSLIQEETNLLGIPPHLLIDQEPVISECSTPQESIDLCQSPTQEEQTESQEEMIALDISTLPIMIPQEEEEVQDIIIPALSQNEQVIPIVTQEETIAQEEEIFIPVIVQEPVLPTTKEEPVTHVISESPIQEEQQQSALPTISEEEQAVLLETAQEATTSHTAITEEEESTTLLNTSQITPAQVEENEQDLSPKPAQVPELTLVALKDDNEKKNEEADFIEISEVAAPIQSFLLEKSAIHPTTLESENRPVPRRLISKETMDDESVNYYKSSRENIHATTSPLPPRIENMTPSASTPNRKRYSL